MREPGNDHVKGDKPRLTQVSPDIIHDGAGDDVLEGAFGGDEIHGDDGNDTLCGDDIVNGVCQDGRTGHPVRRGRK